MYTNYVARSWLALHVASYMAPVPLAYPMLNSQDIKYIPPPLNTPVIIYRFLTHLDFIDYSWFWRWPAHSKYGPWYVIHILVISETVGTQFSGGFSNSSRVCP